MNHAETASLEPAQLVLSAPYCTVNIAEINFTDHVGMRAAQLGEVLRMMAGEHPDSFMLKLCARLSGELRSSAYNNLPESLVLAKQIAEICLCEQDDDDGPNDLLWLCQQMAGELREILSAMTKNANQGGAQ